WNNVRFEGVPPPVRPLAGIDLVDARTISFDKLAAYDRRFVPAERESFLAAWVGLPERASLVALRGGEIVGFAVMRACPAGYKIGPLYAGTADIAMALTSGLAAKMAPRTVVIDVPDVNAPALRLAEQMGFKTTSMSARMYTGTAPAIDRAGLFG